MSKSRILFVTPPYHCGVVEAAGHWIPMTFVYLAGAARDAGLEPVIYDAMTRRCSHADIAKVIEETKPDYVATTAITSTVVDALTVLESAKKVNPEVITLIGGVHPTFMCEETLQNKAVDYVVRDEGEETLRVLLRCLEENGDPAQVAGIAYRADGRVVRTPARPFVKDLDALTTAWDLIEWKDYTLFVMPGSRLGAVNTSRGCNHDCKFCSQQKFWQKTWRGRDPGKVAAELEMLKSRYGMNVVLFSDEYPTRDAKHWEDLLDVLIKKKLGISILMETRPEDIVRDKNILHKYREAGVIHVYVGVEATDQETLDLIKKDVSVQNGMDAIRLLDENGIITETSFILGFPHETKETVERTLRLSKIYNPDFAHYLALAPWPYADMYKELEPYVVDKDYRKYNLIDPVIKPINMSREDIDWAIINCYRSFYMDKLREVLNVKDAFKRDYLLRSMKLIMSSSFITEKLGTLGKLPPEMAAAIKAISAAHPDTTGSGHPGIIPHSAR
ncbi:MAG: magnesium-protoporphyrin IX monomethyl ester oxidative cyclase [Verrucomicrobia bacterium]|nr:magnesium-protoporphyrin IX monomethyl ester oxidative cyclase [Verrucomicrobiota bacterium]